MINQVSLIYDLPNGLTYTYIDYDRIPCYSYMSYHHNKYSIHDKIYISQQIYSINDKCNALKPLHEKGIFQIFTFGRFNYFIILIFKQWYIITIVAFSSICPKFVHYITYHYGLILWCLCRT